jgi:hypothetical protein
MNKLSQLSKILIVFLAGFVLLISTACSSTDSAQASRGNFTPGTNAQKLTTEQPDYDYYDANQPKQGGMNKYNDDTRLDNPKMQEKADELVNRARANLQQRNDSREEYVNEVSKTGQVLGNIKDDFAQKTEEFTRDISKGAQQRMDTAKKNLDKASINIKQAAENTSDAVGDKLDDTAKATRRTAEDTLDRIGDPS